MKGFVTTSEAATRLGVSPTRIRQMILAGQIKAEQIGRDKFIKESEMRRIENLERKPGRPSK